MQHPVKLANDIAVTLSNIPEIMQKISAEELGYIQDAFTGIISARLQFWKDEIIERCAESARIDEPLFPEEPMTYKNFEVDKQSVLDVKKELQ